VRAGSYLVDSRLTEGPLYSCHQYSSSPSYNYYCYYYYYYYWR
jgi:hypothetical protein